MSIGFTLVNSKVSLDAGGNSLFISNIVFQYLIYSFIYFLKSLCIFGFFVFIKHHMN